MKQTFCIVGAPTRKNLKRTIALACFVGLGLVGCGQKGPLSLPQTPTASPPAQPQPQTVPNPR